MIGIFLGLLCCQATPGPIDAFRANKALIATSADFTCKYYANVSTEFIGDLREFRPGVRPANDPYYTSVGKWEFDGNVEHYVIKNADASRNDSRDVSGPVQPCEVLYDGTLIAYHLLVSGEDALNISTEIQNFPFPLIGPFTWSRTVDFDRELEHDFRQPASVVIQRTQGPHEIITEVYERSSGDFKVRREISYDSHLGYIPRSLRAIAYGIDEGRNVANVIEFYLIDASMCAKGGFVPTEWYTLSYDISDFGDSESEFQVDNKISVPKINKVVHYTTLTINSLTSEVRLDELGAVGTIYGPGGFAVLNGKPTSLGLNELKVVARSQLRRSSSANLPNIDQEELHKFDRPESHLGWLKYLLATGFFLAALISFWRYRKAKHLLVVVLSMCVAGCGEKEINHMSTDFLSPRIIFDSSQEFFSLPMRIQNDGNASVTVFDIKASCSCRKVDVSALPAKLRPGDGVEIAVKLSPGMNYSPQSFPFTVVTSKGTFTTIAQLHSIPNHILNPLSITMNGLYEGGSVATENSFEIIHREVFDPRLGRSKTRIVTPQQFSATRSRVQEGIMKDANDIVYIDTTYLLTLNDESLGLHRESILLVDDNGKMIRETPVVWQRLPFLSSVPDKALLGARPLRCFLRCPDESIELLRVVSMPNGVRAIVTSPREVTISLSPDAPEIINELVEVATNKSGEYLKIPVVRFARNTGTTIENKSGDSN